MNVRLIAYLLFLAGFLYYCILPIVILYLFPDYLISDIVLEKYSNPLIDIYIYFLFTYFVLFSFGFYVCSVSSCVKPINEKGLGGLSIIVTTIYFILMLLIIDFRQIISPVGYTEGYDTAHRGQLTTLYLVSIWWYAHLRFVGNAKNQIRLMQVIILMAALNLLVLGSRLGVITGMITFALIYAYGSDRKLKLQDGGTQNQGLIKWIFVALVVLVIMATIGLLRAGEKINLEGVVGILVAEPLFIYASFPAYFSNNTIPMFALPIDFILSIAGAIPSIIFPGKLDFFIEYGSINADSSAGFGGMNQILTLIVNFGLIGFPVAAFFAGAFFGMLVRYVNASAFSRAVVMSSIAVLPFIMFREGAQTSVKLLFFNFLIFPFLIMQVLLLAKKIIRLAQHRAI